MPHYTFTMVTNHLPHYKKYKPFVGLILSAITVKTTQQLLLRRIGMPASLSVTQSVAFVNFQMV